jgi:hypothetical protein
MEEPGSSDSSSSSFVSDFGKDNYAAESPIYPTFEYKQLDPSKREIRLATLLLRQIRRNLGREQLFFNIEHFPLTKLPISSMPCPRLGAVVPLPRRYGWITQYSKFVRTFTRPYILFAMSLDQSFFWIDAICINQKDDLKKAH